MKALKTLLKKYEDLTIYILVAVLLIGLIALMLWSETGEESDRLVYRAAIISISTKAFLGSSLTANAARAGQAPLKYLP